MKDFSGLLRIRSEGHHSRCAICVRHRLIIRRVGRGPARRQQILLFKRHLCRQYRDRQVYWGHRCKSRDDAVTGAPATFISCIIDSMDQQKHSCPRSEAMASKEFNSWNRPRLQSTTLIVHGHCVITGLSPPNTPGGGSRTMELIAYAMTKPLKYVQWSNVFLCLEADNCSKELKHQTSLRMMASMIAQCQLRGCEYNYLQSGHSHEDVDAFFPLYRLISNDIANYGTLNLSKHVLKACSKIGVWDPMSLFEKLWCLINIMTGFSALVGDENIFPMVHQNLFQ